MGENIENQDPIATDVIFLGIYKSTWFLMKKASFYLVKIANEFYWCIERISEGFKAKQND